MRDGIMARPDDCLLLELVGSWAERTPDVIAVADEYESVSFRSLLEQVDGLARRLRALGIGIESRVAISIGRSAQFIVAALAVLRAGGGYVPIDESYPVHRRSMILDDCGVELVIGDRSVAIPGGPPVIGIAGEKRDGADTVATDTMATNCFPVVPAQALAYIIYTSGSTGEPKGVAITRDNITDLVLADPRLAIAPGERVGHLAPTAFDAATFEIWATLCRGGTAVVLRDVRLCGLELGAWLRTAKLDWLFLTSGLFHLVAEQDPGSFEDVGVLITGGDILSPARVAAAASLIGKQVYAAYGPTETTVFTSLYQVNGADVGERVPLGHSLRGKRMRILDDLWRPVADGETGEIFISGTGLARGYFGRPDLTAERFLPDPDATVPGARMYRTGDRGRCRPTGVLEFCGRLDRQVKVRGFRVELGEIESVIQAHESVGAVSATVIDDQFGKRIVVHVAPVTRGRLDGMELRQWLAERLPEYMRPHNLILMESLPLGVNGKIQRDNLPNVWSMRAEQDVRLPPYQAPRTELEAMITNAFVDVLLIDRVGRNDSFFELGGDSLRSVQVIRQLRDNGIAISARQFFRYCTVAQVAAFSERQPVAGEVGC